MSRKSFSKPIWGFHPFPVHFPTNVVSCTSPWSHLAPASKQHALAPLPAHNMDRWEDPCCTKDMFKKDPKASSTSCRNFCWSSYWAFHSPLSWAALPLAIVRVTAFKHYSVTFDHSQALVPRWHSPPTHLTLASSAVTAHVTKASNSTIPKIYTTFRLSHHYYLASSKRSQANMLRTCSKSKKALGPRYARFASWVRRCCSSSAISALECFAKLTEPSAPNYIFFAAKDCWFCYVFRDVRWVQHAYQRWSLKNLPTIPYSHLKQKLDVGGLLFLQDLFAPLPMCRGVCICSICMALLFTEPRQVQVSS